MEWNGIVVTIFMALCVDRHFEAAFRWKWRSC